MLATVPDALDVLLPLCLAWSLVLRVVARRRAEDTSWRRAVVLFALAAAATTTCVLTAATVVIGVLLARTSWLSHWGRWPRTALPEPGMSSWWAVPVVLVLLALLGATARHVVLVVRSLWRAELACRDVDTRSTPDGGTWTVLESTSPDAFALPGWRRPVDGGRHRGRVVVSSAMLAALDPDQQRVLVEHERSHLRHRHPVWIQLAESCAVLNPLLRGVPDVVRAAAERQADLDAAASVADQELTARTIATAALARARVLPGERRPPAPAATGGDVVHRVEYLLRPEQRRSTRSGTLLLGAIVLLASTTSLVTGYCAIARLDDTRARTTATAATDATALQTLRPTSAPIP